MNSNLTASSPRQRIAELDLVRAFAIIGVVTVHATSFATLEMTAFSPASSFLYIAANIGMKFATPVFLFLSSLVLFLRYGNLPLTKETLFSFYKKRLIDIIIPYLACSTIYYIVVAVTRTDEAAPSSYLLDFAAKLATGTAYAHLYYIFIIIQFYLLFPLALKLFQAMPRLVLWGIPMGVAIQVAFYIAGQYVEVPHVGSWSLSYFSYYLLGAFVGSNYSRIREWMLAHRRSFAGQVGLLLIWAGWLAAGLAHIVLWYRLKMYGIASPSSALYALWSVHAYLSALVLTHSAVMIERGSTTAPAALAIRWLKKLSAYSFGIYLLHPLLLAAYRELRPAQVESYVIHLWYGGGFLLALFGAWAIVAFAQRYIPLTWVFLGPNEGRRRRFSQ